MTHEEIYISVIGTYCVIGLIVGIIYFYVYARWQIIRLKKERLWGKAESELGINFALMVFWPVFLPFFLVYSGICLFTFMSDRIINAIGDDE